MSSWKRGSSKINNNNMEQVPSKYSYGTVLTVCMYVCTKVPSAQIIICRTLSHYDVQPRTVSVLYLRSGEVRSCAGGGLFHETGKSVEKTLVPPRDPCLQSVNHTPKILRSFSLLCRDVRSWLAKVSVCTSRATLRQILFC